MQATFDMGLQEPIIIKTDDEDDEEANEDSSEDEDRRSKCFFKFIYSLSVLLIFF